MSGWRDIQRAVAGRRARLIDHLQRPEQRQHELLREILVRNRDTQFGRRFAFRELVSAAEYQQRVPLHSYEDVRDDVRRMMQGEQNVLCADEVRLFEETGGSTGGQKYVPLTKASLEGLRRAILPWIDDLIQFRPQVASGHAYWSISPVMRRCRRTRGGTPIGMDNDAAYFGDDIAVAISETLAVPAAVAASTSFEAWRLQTLSRLLGCRDLSFVSVWSPTFLLQLLDTLARDPEPFAAGLRLADPDRFLEVREWARSESRDWCALWPNLNTISCWCSASSRRYADRLQACFPGAIIQGKGLLATEGVVTVPLLAASAPVLAIDSAYYEFIGDSGELVDMTALERGNCYTVVLTTAAGLYRYNLGDRLRVIDRYQNAPCLEYVGRDSAESDLCGEKLHETFVRDALEVVPGSTMLVPLAGDRPSYLLLLDATAVSSTLESKIVQQVDGALRKNPQYRYACDLGQLAPLSARRLADPIADYHRVCLEAGQQLGDIKPTSLASARWADAFQKAQAG